MHLKKQDFCGFCPFGSVNLPTSALYSLFLQLKLNCFDVFKATIDEFNDGKVRKEKNRIVLNSIDKVLNRVFIVSTGKYECLCPRNYVGVHCERYDTSNPGVPQTTPVIDICVLNGCKSKAQNGICQVRLLFQIVVL
jgi:hypothetical protein